MGDVDGYCRKCGFSFSEHDAQARADEGLLICPGGKTTVSNEDLKRWGYE